MVSFAFPLAVALTVLFRHLVLPLIFNEVELLAVSAKPPIPFSTSPTPSGCQLDGEGQEDESSSCENTRLPV